MQKRNHIPKTQEEIRKICCNRFRKRYRTADLDRFLFADECYVTVQKFHHHQNNRCYGKSFELILDRKKFLQIPKTPLSAMIFGAVPHDGRTPLSFSSQDSA
ncbi:hypothetical protein BV898_02840 [Hypsibius exemplaris]|uniref:DDE-1 domain-containing protein n=1 Tax=Hypsibius exemplaris TaxID=2072580 RepID=A0A1W0X7K1_HYPEX|nr:hypothetical protein BV898_02840 [Hypsibius exemplaris]